MTNEDQVNPIVKTRAAQLRLVPLSNGGSAIIDTIDLPIVSAHVWHLDTQGYARANIKIDGRWRLVRMHRFLICPLPSQFIDHIDCDRLNNSRANLRVCTAAESMGNVRKYGGTSKYKGVSWHGAARKWMAQIRIDGKNRYLGLFETEADAFAAYCDRATQARGEFARLA